MVEQAAHHMVDRKLKKNEEAQAYPNNLTPPIKAYLKGSIISQ